MPAADIPAYDRHHITTTRRFAAVVAQVSGRGWDAQTSSPHAPGTTDRIAVLARPDPRQCRRSVVPFGTGPGRHIADSESPAFWRAEHRKFMSARPRMFCPGHATLPTSSDQAASCLANGRLRSTPVWSPTGPRPPNLRPLPFARYSRAVRRPHTFPDMSPSDQLHGTGTSVTVLAAARSGSDALSRRAFSRRNAGQAADSQRSLVPTSRGVLLPVPLRHQL